MPNIGRHKKTKIGGKAAKAATSHGISITQMTTDASTVKTVSALATGTAVGATGIGLLIGAGALTLGGATLAGVSAYKTNNHINHLKKIKDSWRRYDCPLKGSEMHVSVGTEVLNYILSKKRTKLHRKAMITGTLGVGSPLETGRAIVKKAYKYCRGTLGESRSRQAQLLANHFLECDCELANEIVAELYSDDLMHKMKGIEKHAVAELLMDKMKSV